MRGKVLIAMSGGVDSSVAALLMREAGYECAAVYLRLFDDDGGGADGDADGDADGGAGGGAAAVEAAACIGIPIETLDARAAFSEKVIDPFVASYLGGDTPNPCVQCNRHIKFGALLDYATEKGFHNIATGHYARISQDGALGRYVIKKGADQGKDQSYMLYALTQQQLARIIFPLGAMSKAEVREIAQSRGLPNANRRESQDICFIPDGDFAAYIEAYAKAQWLPHSEAQQPHSEAQQPNAGAQPLLAERLQCDGPIIDSSGAEIGRHKGAFRYTIGQRKGLGLAAGVPIYVYKKSMADNAVYVGQQSMLYSQTLIAGDINLMFFEHLCGTMRVAAKTRYRQPEQPATIEQLPNGTIRATFDEPQRAITPGQAAVFYIDDTVVGGGTIIPPPQGE